MAINHYQLLGIPEDADLRRVKAAYRSMAKRFHPDANQGSEAAAELFRQLNEAYRVLSDESLRKAYDQTIVPTQAPPVREKRPEAKNELDPQQKFNRFLNSLLDAIFTAPDPPATEPQQQAAPKKPRPVQKPKRRPDFNFYYCLAMEQGKQAYRCDDDGIFRPNRSAAGKVGRQFRKNPGMAVLLLLFSGLWEFLKQ